METPNLKGRMVDDVPFSGLVERLCQITMTCEVAGQAKADLNKDDLMSIISTIMATAVEGLAFTTATREEIAGVQNYLIAGLEVRRAAPN